MATKFTLQPAPTFKADVKIPRAGAEDGELTFTFKHMPLDQLSQLEKLDGKTALDFITDITAAWALPEKFTRENLEVLMNNYPGALKSITATYYRELLGNREKN
ncbi:hypothetical protein WP3W18E02_19800 [Klebsiella sp. WP3-W18-ESBL-02]|uniref:phage tail assembly chaperone n=1 Tax=Klebsiella sp. WP3-W18-ESBL-02 TaxID=2675710 RepID=UPI0015DC293D|nr:phage tail assembly chaperone [Klebsiella sp. WP3-W18-ESBL-02]BBQ83451.1 hypothetical protein WP3W18E02_19800 [Klebsiella sp. WP3-W18-ESBL-02]